MKFIILFNILLILGAVLAAKSELDDDSGEETTTAMNIQDENNKKDDSNTNNRNDIDTNKNPLNFFFGQQSHSVFNSNGNGIVVSSRFDSNGKEEKYISIGNPRIRVDGDQFTCTTLTCPENTFKCHVTSEAIADDRNNMKTKSECIDKDGKVLKDSETVEPNPYPNAEPPFSRVATVDINGGIEIDDSTGRNTFHVKKLSKEEQEQLNRDLQEQNRRMNEMFAHQQLLFQQQMDELNRQLASTFGNPNFPFGNYNPFRQQPFFSYNSFPSFGNNWPFGSGIGFQSNFPFGNNWPFRNRDVNFDTIDIDGPSNTFYVETSNNNPTNNPHDPNTFNPFAPQRPTKEIVTEFDDDNNERNNEIFGDTISVNNVHNSRYNEKYRYAHGY